MVAMVTGFGEKNIMVNKFMKSLSFLWLNFILVR